MFPLSILVMALIVPAITLRYPPETPDAGLPRLILWASERPDDLRQLPRDVGVAFLAQTITIAGGAHVVSRRRQGLLVDPGTRMIAVTRIEAPGDVTGADVNTIARAIADRGRLPMVSAVQIDFDARASQRAMYRQLLYQVRAALPQSMPLSMTALASWCLDDNWLDELPVDEAIPMLFRMGPAEQVLRREWTVRTKAPKCRGAIGTSLDEPYPVEPRERRVYVFNPGAWTPASVTAARQTRR